MSKKTTILPYAAVSRLAHVDKDTRVSKEAIAFGVKDAEAHIRKTFNEAIPFMEHRGGTMILLRDIEASRANKEQ
jgi:histone H3/H4